MSNKINPFLVGCFVAVNLLMYSIWKAVVIDFGYYVASLVPFVFLFVYAVICAWADEEK